MIVNRMSQVKCVTCDEPNAEWVKDGIGWVRCDRNSFTSFRTSHFGMAQKKQRQTSVVVGVHYQTMEKHFWYHKDERHI